MPAQLSSLDGALSMYGPKRTRALSSGEVDRDVHLALFHSHKCCFEWNQASFSAL